MQDTKDFLKVLGKEFITIQTFADKSNVRTNVIRVFHGEIDGFISDLQKLNKQHAGIYFMVNDGDLQGRKTENVTKVVAYFADLDGEPLRENYPLEPTAIIQSSEGRYQLYWRVSNAPLETFSHVQSKLASMLNADPVVKDLPRVMRLPGFYHMKGKPQRVENLFLMPNVYSAEQFMSAFDIGEPKPKRAYVPLPKVAEDFLKKKYRGVGGNLKAVTEAGQGSRNITLFRQAAAIRNDISKGLISEQEAYLGLYEAGLYTGLDEQEINRTIQSAWRYGKLN